MPHGDRQELVEAARARELPAHRVERRRPLLAISGGLCLQPDPRGQTARHEPDHQHHHEGEKVADVGDREREDRGHEEEVEGGDAQDRSHERRPAPVARGDHDDSEQIDHDQIGELEERQGEPRRPGGQRNDRHRPAVGGPVGGDRPPAHGCRGHTLTLALGADHVDVDVAAAHHERVDDRADQDPRPEPASWLAHDDLRHVAVVREGQDRLAHLLSGQPGRLGTELLGQAERLRDSIAHVGR